MNLIDILPQLEAIARRINFQPLDDLIQQIRRFCDHMLRQLTPGEPIREGGQALNAYADRLNDLTTQLNAGLEQVQQSYTGPASAQYVATTTAAMQRARPLQTHINDAATYHSTLANHSIEAVFQQGMLVAQGAVMAIDLGSLIFTAGVDAPVSVPVAAGDAVVAEGSAVAMDAAVDGAEATMSVIGDSAADLGEVTGDLSEEGTSALEDGGTVGETGAAEGDPAPTEGGAGSGEEPPSEGGSGGGNGGGNDGSTPGDRLPDRQPGDKTRGVLRRGDTETDLISGKAGPSSSMPSDTPGMRSDMAIRSHVEAHAAALMRQEGVQEATLYINNAPCAGPLGCDAMLPNMLPEGATLDVYIKDGAEWIVQTYEGLPDSTWEWPVP